MGALAVQLVRLSVGMRLLSISILLLISSTNLVPCFDCSAHFSFHHFQSLVRWDSLHFFSISSLQRSEQHFAFAPAIFLILLLLKVFLLSLLPIDSLLLPFLLLLSVTSLATAFSIASSLILFYLTLEIFQSIEFARLTTILHILSPSPATQVVAYTEPFFAFFSFSTIYSHVLLQKLTSNPELSWFKKFLFKVGTAFLAALATSFRSLGIFHSAFWCFDFLIFSFDLLSKYLVANAITPNSRKIKIKPSFFKTFLPIIKNGTETLIMILITISPFLYDQWIGYQKFCKTRLSESDGEDQDKIRFISKSTRPWCSNSIPSIYNFVQSHYWRVGFLKYWTWNQSPLFLLSFPIYFITIKSLTTYYLYYFQENVKKKNSNNLSFLDLLLNSKPINRLTGRKRSKNDHHSGNKAQDDNKNKEESKNKIYRPFLTRKIEIYVHIQLLITMILLFNSHVQIILRQASTMPFIWWGLADQIGVNWNWWSSSKSNLQQQQKNVQENQKKSIYSSLSNLDIKSWYFYWLVVWWPISLVLWAAFYPPA